MRRRTPASHVCTILLTLIVFAGCKSVVTRQDVRPRVLRDVPAQNLAYRLSPDATLPVELNAEDLLDKLEAVASDFATRRTDDALLRTVKSPDGSRVLAVYAAGDETGAGDRADRGAGDNVGLQTRGDQAFQHADMGPTAGGAATKRYANCRSCHVSSARAEDGPAMRPQTTILEVLPGLAECGESSRGSYYSELFKVPFAAPE